MARLNYHHLYYFWRVATEGKLTKVADDLHVAQSALSSQIRQLEASTGAALFDRQGRRLELTDVGRRVLDYANDIFTAGEELEAYLKRGEEREEQRLRIGMLTTLSRNFIDRLIMPWLADPMIRFSLQSDSLENLLDGLVHHQLDVALTNADVRGGDEQIWQSQLLARQAVSIVGPPDKKPATAFPAGYDSSRWVLPTRDNEIRRAFEAFCTQAQFTPVLEAEANDMAMLRLLARDSGAYAVLPTVVVNDEIRDGILVEYMRLPNVFESFYAITVKRRFESPALGALLDDFKPFRAGAISDADVQ
ncbi:MAG: LysR family transcriptional regulator [Pseudomonadota bacterium]